MIMTIKRILVPLPGSVDHSTGEIDLAMSTAKALDAYVEALFISEPPPVTRGGVGTGAVRYGGAGAAVAAPINFFAEEREKHAREARERFTLACVARGIPILPATDAVRELPAASWRETEGSYVEAAMQRAAAFDLMVAASAAVMGALKDIAEQALLLTRRPVLLAPARLETELTSTAMIAWDESPECWHAVSAALPLLRLAKAVKVVSVDRDKASGARLASQAEALAYLRCHGIEATAQIVAPDLRSVGDTLLAAAGEHDVGLMVMGAYSHSRLREMLLGGATRHMLKNASARPVLMAH
jgi:nucleotide-binding universal stress UspA family protein